MINKKRFVNKVVIITGASSGIGKDSAIRFAKEGAKVVLVSRSKEKLDNVANEIKEFKNNEVLVLPTDVSKLEQVQNKVKEVISRFGQIDILFNNAGSSEVGLVSDKDFTDDVKKLFSVDFLGTVNFSKEVLPIMKSQGSGHIMNMSSVVGRKAFPHFGAYSSIMHAITGFNAALRQELRDSGITVSIIHPALTQTPLLEHVNPENMPPPFRRFTPIPVSQVSKAVLDGIYKKRQRIVVPFQPSLMLFADALSPSIGDLIVRLLPNKIFAFLLRSYKGKIYDHKYN